MVTTIGQVSRSEIIERAVDNAPVGIGVWRCESDSGESHDLRLMFINNEGARFAGARPGTLMGRTMADAFPELDETELPSALSEAANSTQPRDIMLRVTGDGGEEHQFLNKVIPLGDGYSMVVFFDVTHEKMLERNYKVERRTGLATRSYFDELLHEACSSQPLGVYTAVVYLDLDRFKSINDEYGHIVGDEVISVVGHRLDRVDGARIAARWGGDEFALLVVGGVADIQRVVSEVEHCFDEPVEVSVGVLSVASSIGVALAEDAKADDREITMMADEAMYRAKKDGRGITRWNILDSDAPEQRWCWMVASGDEVDHD